MDEKSKWIASSLEVDGYRIPKPIIIIVGINTIVFLAWRMSRKSMRSLNWMTNHFTTSFYQVRQGRWWTLLTSAFSHEQFWHFLFNNLALVSLATPVVQIMGDKQFTLFYLGSAVFSSVFGMLVTMLTSVPHSRLARLAVPSLGASGAVFGVFAVHAMILPDSKFYILLIPVAIKASTLLPCLVLFDVGGVIYNRYAHSMLGHGTHLGGALSGYLLMKLYLEKNNYTVRRLRDHQRIREAWRR